MVSSFAIRSDVEDIKCMIKNEAVASKKRDEDEAAASKKRDEDLAAASKKRDEDEAAASKKRDDRNFLTMLIASFFLGGFFVMFSASGDSIVAKLLFHR